MEKTAQLIFLFPTMYSPVVFGEEHGETLVLIVPETVVKARLPSLHERLIGYDTFLFPEWCEQWPRNLCRAQLQLRW